MEMGAEDFGYMFCLAPGAMFQLVALVPVRIASCTVQSFESMKIVYRLG